MIAEAQQATQVSSVSLAGRWASRNWRRWLPLVISNNTSAVHLASLAGTPVVDLYVLTNPHIRRGGCL